MKWHRRALLVAMPAVLAGGVALAVQEAPTETKQAPEPVADVTPSPKPQFAPMPEGARVLAAAADTGRFLSTPEGALDTLAARVKERGDRPIVVVQYGDSHTQAGILSREIRDALAQGGLTSPGYVAPGIHNVGDAKATTAGRWTATNWLKGDDAGSYGPLGAVWVTRDPSALVRLHLKTPAREGTTVTALYYRTTRHLPFRINAEGQLLAQVDPSMQDPADMHVLGRAQVTIPAGTSDVELSVAPTRKLGPELRFFGFVVQVPGAVVEWDALGIQGASIDHPLTRGDSTIEEYLAWRQPDMVVAWFGSNSLVAPNFNATTYGQTVESFLARLKAAAPTAARVAIGPPDLARRPSSCPTMGGGTTTKVVKHGKTKKTVTTKNSLTPQQRAIQATFICEPEKTVTTRAGRDEYPIKSIRTAVQWADYLQSCQISTLPSVATCTEATRSAAERQGFAFFDTYAFMDGAGSIHRWACQQPQLARFDHVHLTPEGYATVGQGIWAALRGTLQISGEAPAAPKSATTATAEEATDDGDGE